MNPTAEKFGYPDSRVGDFEHWVVLLRPAQVTLGSLVLVCKESASRFGEISREAAAELATATDAIEGVLGAALAHDKINYLMLMMVDPDVHFHIIPRYQAEREYAGVRFGDPFWPGPPDINQAQEVPDAALATLLADLRERFEARAS